METVRFQVRDAALIEILLHTGVGLAEIARLRLTDVQLPPAQHPRSGERRDDHGRWQTKIGAQHFPQLRGLRAIGTKGRRMFVQPWYRINRPSRALRRRGLKLDNIALVPASLLPFKRQW